MTKSADLERVAVLGGELAVGAAELVDVGVRLGVAVEHRLVVAAVRALVALVGTRAVVAAQMVLEVVAQLGGERTARTLEHLVGRHVLMATMDPQFFLSSGIIQHSKVISLSLSLSLSLLPTF